MIVESDPSYVGSCNYCDFFTASYPRKESAINQLESHLKLNPTHRSETSLMMKYSVRRES